MNGKSTDIVGQNIERLKELFPDVFTEGKIDFDVLRETLGYYVDDRQERYTWDGKMGSSLLLTLDQYIFQIFQDFMLSDLAHFDLFRCL